LTKDIPNDTSYQAEVAHLVEHDLAKVGVAGSSPVFRSRNPSSDGGGIFFEPVALVVELVDTQDLNKSSLKKEISQLISDFILLTIHL
jgi:hypothetical protein